MDHKLTRLFEEPEDLAFLKSLRSIKVSAVIEDRWFGHSFRAILEGIYGSSVTIRTKVPRIEEPRLRRFFSLMGRRDSVGEQFRDFVFEVLTKAVAEVGTPPEARR